MRIKDDLYSPYSEHLSLDVWMHKVYGKPSNIFYQDKTNKQFINWITDTCKEQREDLYFVSSGKWGGVEGEATWYIHFPKLKCVLRMSPDDGSYNVKIWYMERDKVASLINKILENKELEPKRTMGLIVRQDNELVVKFKELTPQEVSLNLNYGEGFDSVCNKIQTSLSSKTSGLVLLHGIPGTGKTSFIKHLVLNVEKKFLFLPNSMAEVIADPQILNLLLDHSDSILVIEDAEKVIGDRSLSTHSEGVSNILNISDGILGDILKIQIIATFNTERSRIDQALLRKGRLVAEHKFDSLSVDDSNRLLKSLGKENRTHKEMTLAEIYNIEDESNTSFVKRERIGFVRN